MYSNTRKKIKCDFLAHVDAKLVFSPEEERVHIQCCEDNKMQFLNGEFIY